MSKHRKRNPKPPKSLYPTGKTPPTISGFSEASVVVHPIQFKKLVDAGVIDEKGRRL